MVLLYKLNTMQFLVAVYCHRYLLELGPQFSIDPRSGQLKILTLKRILPSTNPRVRISVISYKPCFNKCCNRVIETDLSKTRFEPSPESYEPIANPFCK